MKEHKSIPTAVLASTALLIGSGGSLFGGEPAPYYPPAAPPSDCSGCIDPGFYLDGSLLYMNSYASDIQDFDGDWDFGFRGSVGFENQSGLFGELTGFLYQGDYDAQNGTVDGEADFYTVDLMIGDTVHCGELCVAFAGGIRYGGLDIDESRGGIARLDESYEFDGWGPAIEISAERSLSEQFALYAELRQSLLFGEAEESTPNFRGSTDTLASITEIGVGIQFEFAIGPVQKAFIRAGVEGQYWLVDSSDLGLWGAVLQVGARF